ncbi:12910_t:CDS:2 [Funneliformis mosseae]|uniref:12910_t:CDS:1 n=1 Tax=Funneliformis mosseae TaxID=27381 RepID=A0A9N9HVH7_FUNMO|nr:12910_t:CDS:2 [Funneliformis mosseae]
MKHIKITLSKHPKVRNVIDPKTVICICGKKVHLDRNYDSDLLNRYIKKKICKSNDGNSQITQFFSEQNSEASKKRILCIRLNDEKVKVYLYCIGFVITFGDVPLPEVFVISSSPNTLNWTHIESDHNEADSDIEGNPKSQGMHSLDEVESLTTEMV